MHFLDLVIHTQNEILKTKGLPTGRERRAPRPWYEPFFNILGHGLGSFTWAMPWPVRRRWAQWVNRSLSHHPYPNAANLPVVQSHVRAMAERLKKESGEWPAFLVLMSHPDTTGPFEWLRFELVRQGLLISDDLVDFTQGNPLYTRHPQCFVAIDPFALDTLSPYQAAFYAGWMHRYYLAWDRQARTQFAIQKHWLLHGSSYPEIVTRLLRRLRENVPISMVISGGLPQNARLLYTSREFVRRLPVKNWPYSKNHAARRMMEIVRQPENGAHPTEQGQLSEKVQKDLLRFWHELGIPDSDHARWLEEFRKEFELEVPYRARLFSLVIKRLAMRGKPLMWLAISHQEKEPYVRIHEPWACVKDSKGQVQWWMTQTDGSITMRPLTEIQTLAETFAQQYVR